MSEAQPTVAEIVDRHRNLIGSTIANEMIAALQDREDNMADLIRLAGVQFGTFPELVAKVLMDVGLGTPPDEALRNHINEQFAGRMEWLRQQFGQGS